MSTELAMVVISQAFSAIIAVTGLLVGLSNSRRADQRADKQTAADLEKLKAEQTYALTMWRAETGEKRHQEIRDRLRQDAADYIALLGEVDDIAAEIENYSRERENRGDWDTHGKPPDRWNPEIRGRLATMAAALTLYGEAVAETAIHAHRLAIDEAENSQRALEDRKVSQNFADLSLATRSFAWAVRERLEELGDGGAKSELYSCAM